MAFEAVLDTSVLYPASVRDALLRLATSELYQPRWSPRIFEELFEVLQRNNLTDPQRLVDTMCEAFPEALVNQQAVDALVDSWGPHTPVGQAMAADPADRHVLAAAVVAGAENVVTENVRHFPEAACSPFGVHAISADGFLCNLFELDPPLATRTIEHQAAQLRKPPLTVDQVLGYIAQNAPTFAENVRAQRLL